MIPSWLVIGGIALGVALLINRLGSAQDFRWFMRLQRPSWLTFEWAIPLIWTFIFTLGAISAVIVWEATRNSWLMGGYLLLEVLIMVYTPVMCKLRSLQVGTVIGAIGWVWGCILAAFVWPISSVAFGLLLPYLLWGPIGTFVTWQMIALNSSDS
jgi:tryptophan-rich sensory protein